MHSGETQYYGLPQYIGSDIMNPLEDTNGAYEIIDTSLHEVSLNSLDASNKATEAKETADGLSNRVTSVETNIETLEEGQAGLSTNMAETFDPMKTGGYKRGEFVINADDGKLYQFINDHSGSWSASDVEEVTVSKMLQYILGIVAEDFDPAKVGGYSVNDYVIYGNRLYKFIHSHSGVWNVADVDEVTVASELTKSAGVIASLSGKVIYGQTITQNYSGRFDNNIKAFRTLMQQLWDNKDDNVVDIIVESVNDKTIGRSIADCIIGTNCSFDTSYVDMVISGGSFNVASFAHMEWFYDDTYDHTFIVTYRSGNAEIAGIGSSAPFSVDFVGSITNDETTVIPVTFKYHYVYSL